MTTNINQMVTQSLQRQLKQIAIQQDEEEIVVEVQFVNDTM
jgi:hypothetical protein